MLDVVKVELKEFKDTCFNMYIDLFPQSERRPWDTIESTYYKGIENFYIIKLDNKPIGFFMLEKLDNHPYYLEYFGIIKEYQNKGYGSESIKKLIEIIKSDGLVGEIDDIHTDEISYKRYEFYKRLGFVLIDKLYDLFGVLYNPVVYNTDSSNITEILCDYYIFNMGIDRFKENVKIIKK